MSQENDKPHSDFSATSKKARANLVQAFKEATNMKAHLYPGLTQKGIKVKPVGTACRNGYQKLFFFKDMSLLSHRPPWLIPVQPPQGLSQTLWQINSKY